MMQCLIVEVRAIFANRYFAAYEVAKKALTPAGSDPSQLNLGAIIIAGGTAGVAMWSIAIPPDVKYFRLLRQFCTCSDQMHRRS